MSDECYRFSTNPNHIRSPHLGYIGYYHRLATARNRDELVHSVLTGSSEVNNTKRVLNAEYNSSHNRSYPIQTAEVARFIESRIQKMYGKSSLNTEPVHHHRVNGTSVVYSIEGIVATQLLQQITIEMQKR